LFRRQLVSVLFPTNGGSGVPFGPQDGHHFAKNANPNTSLTGLTNHAFNHIPEP
jgi:hypothetical protein